MTESQTTQRRTTQAATQHKITEPLTTTDGKIKPEETKLTEAEKLSPLQRLFI